MSELKVFELKVGKNLETDSPLVVGVDDKWNPRIMSGEKVYLKYEADKVIEELKEIDSKNRSAYYKDLSMMAKDVERHKYKRCLAMASTCRLRARWFGDNAFYKKEQWALQWHKRWLELSEKFKEAK